MLAKRTGFVAILLVMSSAALAQTWNGAGANDSFSNGANWIGAVAPVNTGVANVIFAGTTRLNPQVDVANSFSGPVTVNAGTLILAKPINTDAFTGSLFIGDGSGVDTVILGNSNQTDTANVTVSSSGIFNLNNFSEVITGLTINGGSTTL